MPADDDTRHVSSSDTITVETTERAATERETWRHWWPDEPADPDHLLTTRALVERARADGVAITDRDIANWQALGILPRGERRRTGRALDMLYPERYVDLLRDVREEQQKGTRRKAIGPLLRVKHAGQHRRVVVRPPTATASADGLSVNVSARAHVRRGDPTLTADDDLARTLRSIARKHEQRYGGHIARAELRLIDNHGNPLTLAVDTD